ncbi:hypothetical protein V3W47_16660 [Deinococcus sp. YIM 134068]|uniref:hypothetical protein n=1 Tax=Deinococcus lichenicola TaxID=3118910 RepID=UPI002F94EAFE
MRHAVASLAGILLFSTAQSIDYTFENILKQRFPKAYGACMDYAAQANGPWKEPYNRPLAFYDCAQAYVYQHYYVPLREREKR